MQRALTGDAGSYRELLTCVTDRLRSYFSRRLGLDSPEIEDLVQETLLAVHVRRHTYEENRPFTPWLHAIAKYKLVDHYRKKRIDIPISDYDTESIFSAGEIEETSARADVNRLLENLPPQTRDYIRSVKIEGQPISTVSARHHVSDSAVKVAIHRGIKQIADRLKRTDTP